MKVNNEGRLAGSGACAFGEGLVANDAGRIIGAPGTGPGQIKFPYDLACGGAAALQQQSHPRRLGLRADVHP